MGCGYSAAFDIAFATPQYQEWNKTFKALGISKAEVHKLYQKFMKVDLDRGGTIDVVELLTVIDVERTPFTERVFAVFDEDNSGKIDFNEFVLSLWNYCTLSRVTLGMFAFDLYDRDSSGILEQDDINKMCRDIFGKSVNTGHYARQTKQDLETFLFDADITLERFLKFAQNHQSLLFPAFQMQLLLKKNILGVRFWESCSQKRVQISKKKYLTIKQILELQATEEQNRLKQLPVQIQSGKLAIQSLGTAHRRKMKYSTDDYDELNSTAGTQDNSHGQSQQSIASLLPGTGTAKVHPAIETVGTVSERVGMRRNSVGAKASTKSSKDPNNSVELMDSIMNNYTPSVKAASTKGGGGGDNIADSKKSTKSKKSTASEDDYVREFDQKTPKPRPTLPPTFEEDDHSHGIILPPKAKDENEIGKSLKGNLSKAGQSVVTANRVGKRRSSI